MMSNEPPQGAQPQHSGNPGGMREAAQALIDRYYSSTLWVDMIDEARALRTALAAPEGPAPTETDEGHWARGVARPMFGGGSAEAPADDKPVAWMRWNTSGRVCSFIACGPSEHGAFPVYSRARAPEAPPPVEARQPQTGEPWDGIKYLLDSYPGAVRCRYKGLDEDLLASLSVTFIGLRDAARAALAAPAGAGEREALRELIAACDAQDEWRMTPTSLRMNLSAVEAYDIGNRVDLAWTAARAALSVSPPGPEIQPHLDHQVGAQGTPLPLDSAGGAPSATAPREHEANEHCWCEPEVDYVDPNTGAKVFVHKQTQ